MMNYDRFLNAAAHVFKKERIQKKEKDGVTTEYVYSLEEIANSKFLDYQKTKSNDDRNNLISYIMELYANLLLAEHKSEMLYSAEGKDDILCECISTLQYIVADFIYGRKVSEFERILESYSGEENKSFLMYFHFCARKKFKTLRGDEESDVAPKISINGRKKIKKINSIALNLFGTKAYFCTDEELEKICDILNAAPDKMFSNLTLDKIKKVIRQNTTIVIPNTTNDDEDGDTTGFCFVDNYSEYSEPNTSAITAEDVCDVLSEMKITDKNRLYFTVFVMYNFVKSECNNEPYLLRISYNAFLSLAGWITEKEKETTDKIYIFIFEAIGKGAKVPKIEEIATEVLLLKSSSQLNYSTKIVVGEIRQRLNYSKRK